MRIIYLMSTVIVALGLASCSKSDISESLSTGSKLNFRVNSGMITRAATETDITGLQTAGVSLYLFDNAGNAAKPLGYPDNMINLAYYEPSTTWDATPPVYLPATGDHMLYSTFPADVWNGTKINDKFAFTYDGFNNGSPVNKDLLVAETPIAETATDASIQYIHALCQVTVYVKYINPIADHYAKLFNVDISSIPQEATYTFGNGSGGNWIPNALSLVTLGDKSVTDTEAKVVGTGNGTQRKQVGETYFIIPESEIKIAYSWGIFDNTTDDLLKGSDTATGPKIYSFTPEQGTRYFITITIDGALKRMTWTVTEKSWVDDNQGENAQP